MLDTSFQLDSPAHIPEKQHPVIPSLAPSTQEASVNAQGLIERCFSSSSRVQTLDIPGHAQADPGPILSELMVWWKKKSKTVINNPTNKCKIATKMRVTKEKCMRP